MEITRAKYAIDVENPQSECKFFEVNKLQDIKWFDVCVWNQCFVANSVQIVISKSKENDLFS